MISLDKPTVVLVHGAWADGSSFSAVTAHLQHHGLTVLHAPNPLRGVPNDTKAVADFVAQATTGPVVLVGHSYGGVVITGAATSLPRVSALVYVDAFAPADGESASSLTNELPGSLLNVADPTTVFDFVLPSPDAAQGEYDSYIKRDKFHAMFAAGIPAREAAVLAASQSPAALAALATPFSGEPAWRTLPSYFFIGTEDRVLPSAQQTAMAARSGGVVTEEKAPHLAMVTHSRHVAKVIIDAAAAI
ncbi:alpha/beta hydrolase [Microbacterium sp. zg.B48]|uniref:alpha/beta fold hydrolase n=1 Tax=Microbacterium sp. zg.B48 TaxID=2969408 RepID=UPI00214B7507|nr:alpha/beta hydrolase [Microbacterium sp. zg.B48]MCR2764255.1 alpha/beta hydrolase [Microbacterium sp. zg.B48]